MHDFMQSRSLETVGSIMTGVILTGGLAFTFESS